MSKELIEATSQYVAGVHPVSDESRAYPMERDGAPLYDWWTETGTATTSGQNMSHIKGFMFAPVWQSVSLISGDVARLGLKLYEMDETGVTDPLPRHPLTRLVNQRPNDEINARKFWRRSLIHFLMWGNAYIWIRRDPVTFEPVELLHLLPDRTTVYRDPYGTPYYVAEVRGDLSSSRLVTLDYWEVVHVEWMQDVHYEVDGLDVMQMARNSWALGLAQEEFSSRFFQHGGRVGGILELPAAMTKKARDNMEADFAKTYEDPARAFKTVVLRDNARFHEAQRSFRDTQLIEATEQQAKQVARWFNIPPSKLGLSDSVSYGSRDADNQAYLDNCLSAILSQFKAELSFKLLTPRQQSNRYFDYETRELVNMDFEKRVAGYSAAINAGIMSPNEARSLENLPPYPGGDDFRNIQPTGPNNETPGGDEEGTEETDEEEPDTEEATRATRASILYTLTNDARRKSGKNLDSMMNWLNGEFTTVRSRSISLLGNDELVDQIRDRLVLELDGVHESELYERTDRTCHTIEMEVLR